MQNSMKMFRKGDRAIYLRELEECTVLCQYRKRNVCVVRFDDGTEDVVNTDDLELR